MKKLVATLIYLICVPVWINAQTIVKMPVTQNPLFEVFTENLTAIFPEEGGEMELGADLVIKGGSGTYSYLWTDASGEILSHEGTLTVTTPGRYLLTVSDTCDCETTVAYDVTTTSVESVVKDETAIFPNPTDGFVEIKGNDIIRVVAVDMSGRMAALYQALPGQSLHEADFSKLTPGVYLLTLTDARNQSYAHRLIRK